MSYLRPSAFLCGLILAFSLHAESGRLTIHMILHAVGEENYEIDSESRLHTTIEFTDRGNKRSTTVDWKPGDQPKGASPFAVQMMLMRTGALDARRAGRDTITVGGKAIHLTRIEFRLLAALAKNAGRVMTHRQLLHQVWGPGTGDQSQYLRVYMNQLRHKIEPNAGQPRYLLTEIGVGYRLVSEE